jgi:hypothetical protein
MKTKSQKKYQTVTVQIDLCEQALAQWETGAWTAPFGAPGVKVIRWFPAHWTLQQRKERERFQAVVTDILDSLTTSVLFPDNPDLSPILYTGCKSVKIVKDGSTRKLIAYFENWATLDKAIGKAFNWHEANFNGVWKRYFSP